MLFYIITSIPLALVSVVAFGLASILDRATATPGKMDPAIRRQWRRWSAIGYFTGAGAACGLFAAAFILL